MPTSLKTPDRFKTQDASFKTPDASFTLTPVSRRKMRFKTQIPVRSDTRCQTPVSRRKMPVSRHQTSVSRRKIQQRSPLLPGSSSAGYYQLATFFTHGTRDADFLFFASFTSPFRLVGKINLIHFAIQTGRKDQQAHPSDRQTGRNDRQRSHNCHHLLEQKTNRETDFVRGGGGSFGEI